MTDRDFLIWLHHRLEKVHGEDPLVDYMHKLRAVILHTQANANSRPCCLTNNLDDTIKAFGVNS
jgi:hypothetical protein